MSDWELIGNCNMKCGASLRLLLYPSEFGETSLGMEASDNNSFVKTHCSDSTDPFKENDLDLDACRVVIYASSAREMIEVFRGAANLIEKVLTERDLL